MDWVGVVRKMELLLMFSTIYEDVGRVAKLYIPSTLNIDLILWHTQLIMSAENVKSWFKSWLLPFTFQAYI